MVFDFNARTWPSLYARLDALGYVQPMDIHTLDDLSAWIEALEARRQLASDRIGAVRVSTVFRGFLVGPFETMLFGPHRLACECWRADDRDQALATHGALVMQLRAALEDTRR
jgi:hypothetical protein